MSGYLLDTSAALVGLTDPDRLPAAVRRAMLTGPNVLSVISYWEVVLKSMKGSLKVGDPRTWWRDAWRRFRLSRRSIKTPSTGC